MIVSIVVLGSRVCGKRVVAVTFLPVQSSTTACLGAACATYSHTRALLSPALDGRLQARMGGWYKDDGRNGWVADASDGPGSSLSLGLAHDVFALPLLLALLCLSCTANGSTLPVPVPHHHHCGLL